MNIMKTLELEQCLGLQTNPSRIVPFPELKRKRLSHPVTGLLQANGYVRLPGPTGLHAVEYALAEGVTHLKLGQPEEAERILREAIGIPTNDEDLESECRYAYGAALLALGRDEEAEAELHWEPGED